MLSQRKRHRGTLDAIVCTINWSCGSVHPYSDCIIFIHGVALNSPPAMRDQTVGSEVRSSLYGGEDRFTSPKKRFRGFASYLESQPPCKHVNPAQDCTPLRVGSHTRYVKSHPSQSSGPGTCSRTPLPAPDETFDTMIFIYPKNYTRKCIKRPPDGNICSRSETLITKVFPCYAFTSYRIEIALSQVQFRTRYFFLIKIEAEFGYKLVQKRG